MRLSTALMLSLGAVLLAGALVSGALSALVWEQLQQAQSPQLVLVLNPTLRETDIDHIYLEVRQLQEVTSLRFASEAQSLSLPAAMTIPPNAPALLLNLNSAASVQQVAQLVGMLDGVQQAIPLEQPNDAPPPDQAQTVKPALFTAFVVLILASFFALSSGVHKLLRQWKGELELLRLSGISAKNVASSF